MTRHSKLYQSRPSAAQKDISLRGSTNAEAIKFPTLCMQHCVLSQNYRQNGING